MCSHPFALDIVGHMKIMRCKCGQPQFASHSRNFNALNYY